MLTIISQENITQENTHTLIISQPGDFIGLNPYNPTSSYYDVFIQDPIYQSLFTYESNSSKKIVPMLAESINQSVDGIHYTVTDVLYTYLLQDVEGYIGGIKNFVKYLGDNITFWGGGKGNGTHQTFVINNEYSFNLNLIFFNNIFTF